jgi:hypothetical protein
VNTLHTLYSIKDDNILDFLVKVRMLQEADFKGMTWDVNVAESKMVCEKATTTARHGTALSKTRKHSRLSHLPH